MKFRCSFCLVTLLVVSLSHTTGTVSPTMAADGSTVSSGDSAAAATGVNSESAARISPASILKAKPDADSTHVIEPLRGYAKHDARGTPVVPEWKMDTGYDALLGKFYVGVVGLKLFPITGPPPAAVLGSEQLKHWRGHKPHPCLLKFTKLQDTSGGYYFQTIGSETGPRGWIIPQAAEPHKAKEWAVYFMQEQDP